MNEKLDAIWRTLQKDDLPSTCRACEDGLYAYAEAVLDNADADARFPSMRPHLDECPTCQTALAEMLALLEMERSGQMQEPPVSARYDFSDLPVAPAPTEPAPRFWRFDELGRLIIQFSAELLQSWQPPGTATRLSQIRATRIAVRGRNWRRSGRPFRRRFCQIPASGA